MLRALSILASVVALAVSAAPASASASGATAGTTAVAPQPAATQGIIMRDGGICDPIRHGGY
jgi:hypothetical protein